MALLPFIKTWMLNIQLSMQATAQLYKHLTQKTIDKIQPLCYNIIVPREGTK